MKPGLAFTGTLRRLGSLAAAPTTPGGSLGTVYYHTSVAASGVPAAAKETQAGQFSAAANVNLNVNMSAAPDLVFLLPTYTFATPGIGRSIVHGHNGSVRPKQRHP
jgi:Flp pilus assembly protein TadG